MHFFPCRFITFSLDAEASIAAEKFNGFELMGKRLRVSVNEQNNSSYRVRSHPDNEDQGSKSREANAKPWGSGACASPAEVRTFSSFGRTSFEGSICFSSISAFAISAQSRKMGFNLRRC